MVLGFVILTGSAIERNIYDDVLFIFLGLIAYCIGCHGILTSYNRVICSGFLLVCPRSKQIQIRIPMEMSMAMSLAGFTLMVLVELCFARDCSGDVLFHLSLLFAPIKILCVYRNKWRRNDFIMLVLTYMLGFGGAAYYAGDRITGFGIMNGFLWEVRLLAFFRGQTWLAIITGYLVLILADGLQYLKLWYYWKKYYAMKKENM